MSDPAAPEWLTRTAKEIRDDAIAYGVAESGYGAGESASHRSTVWQPMGMMMAHAWRTAIRPIARAIDPETAPAWYLRRHGMNARVPWRAQPRATLAAGAVVAAGGQTYTTDAEVTLPAGEATAVAVTAAAAGAAGNVAAGAEAAFDPAPAGAVADATVALQADWITWYGFNRDADDVEAYRQRVLAGMRLHGEAEADNSIPDRYRVAALGVPGVSSVALARTPRDYGSMDLAVLVRGRLPTTAELELVRSACARAGLVCRDLWVRAPEAITVQVELTYTGSATTAAVEQAVDAWWRAHIGIGKAVLVEDLYRQATADLAGVYEVDYNSPGDNLRALPSVWYRPIVNAEAAT